MRVRIDRKVLATNEELAAELRSQFQRAGLYVLNVMGSPGSGKTSLLERTLERIGTKVAVIEGDIATSLDTDRLARFGSPVVQINTGGACHLDAAMVRKALDSLDLSGCSILAIENVGNLVCPAQFDLGEADKVVVCSLPEGDDKVAKYPAMFTLASAVVLNKVDLMGHVDFNLPRFKQQLAELNARAELFEVSCRTCVGIDRWIGWLEQRIS